MNDGPATWTVFLDRDGVLNRKAPEGAYIRTPAEFEWLPGSRDAVKLLNDAGVLTIVVTNQRGVARGLMTAGDLETIHGRLRDDLAREGARMDAIYVCPHDRGTCRCRKPDTGLLEDARARYPQISFARAFVVGDAPTDIELGRRVGARTILVGPGLPAPLAHPPDAAAPSLLEAVTHHILPTIRASDPNTHD